MALAIRLATRTDYPMLADMANRFAAAYPEALDWPWLTPGLAPQSYVEQENQLVAIPVAYDDVTLQIGGFIIVSVVGSRVIFTSYITEPTLTPNQQKAVLNELARRVGVEARNRGMTHVHWFVRVGWTAAINFWKAFGLNTQVAEVEARKLGDVYLVTVDLTTFEAGNA